MTALAYSVISGFSARGLLHHGIGGLPDTGRPSVRAAANQAGTNYLARDLH